MVASVGILTATGGMTCHAAVVARSMNKTCVVGAGTEVMAIAEGTSITIDGGTGNIWVGVDVPVENSAQDPSVIGVLEALIATASATTLIKARPAEAVALADRYGKALNFDVQVSDAKDMKDLAAASNKIRGVARAALPFGKHRIFAEFVGLDPEGIRDGLADQILGTLGPKTRLKGVGRPVSIAELVNSDKANVDLSGLDFLSDDDIAALRGLMGDKAFATVEDSIEFPVFLREVLGG